jgi:hypothetical protein
MTLHPVDPLDYRELFAITGHLRELRHAPSQVTWAHHVHILQELCSILTEAIGQGLEQVLYSANANDPSTQAFARLILSDLRVFTDFLKFEKDVLVKCGVDAVTADDIVAAIRPLYTELKRMTFDPAKTFAAIESLRDDVCKASRSARSAMNRAKTAVDDQKRVLKVYGVAATVANLSTIAITLGASSPFIAISTVAGSLLISHRTDIKNPLDHPPR